jgi:hypothetical protein
MAGQDSHPGGPHDPARAEHAVGEATWALMLGKWTAVARASVALPDTPHGRRWKAAIPSVIMLQAVTMSLIEARQLLAEGRLAIADAQVCRDKAAVLIEQHRTILRQLWHADHGGAAGGNAEGGAESVRAALPQSLPPALPPSLAELIADAEDAAEQW